MHRTVGVKFHAVRVDGAQFRPAGNRVADTVELRGLGGFAQDGEAKARVPVGDGARQHQVGGGLCSACGIGAARGASDTEQMGVGDGARIDSTGDGARDSRQSDIRDLCLVRSRWRG